MERTLRRMRLPQRSKSGHGGIQRVQQRSQRSPETRESQRSRPIQEGTRRSLRSLWIQEGGRSDRGTWRRGGASAGVLFILLGAWAATGEAASRKAKCDLGLGQWVQDSGLPWYTGRSCRAIDNAVNCATLGRTDFTYQKWRWQPFDCPNWQRVTPVYLGRLLRNRVVVVAGDSVSKHVASSLTCLVDAAPQTGLELQKIWIKDMPFYATKVANFNLTILRIFSNYLNRATPLPDGRRGHMIDLDRLDPALLALLSVADVTLLAANAWWPISNNEYYIRGKRQYIGFHEAYQKGLETLGYALDSMKYKGKAFLLSPSPTHYSYPPQASRELRSCEVKTPWSTKQASALWKRDSFSRGFMYAQKQALGGNRRIQLLDVARMSEARADGHIASAGRGPGAGIDCLHWCEAGVTDAWIELIYNKLKGS